jgi:hypothetical protein
VTEPSAAIIAAVDLISALRERAGVTGRVLTFTDADPRETLAAILRERPDVVILERFFAATPRGVALIRRLQIDPALENVEIRVLAHDSDHVRVIARRRTLSAGGTATTTLTDPAGTRTSRRMALSKPVEAQIDGKTVNLLDLSSTGAQVLSPAVLRPNQRVRLTLWIEQEALRIGATVEWSSFEMDRETNETRYRAGLAFGAQDAAALERFCERLGPADER